MPSAAFGAALLTLTLATPATATPAAPRPAATGAPVAGTAPTRPVTLITGDRVAVRPGGGISVHPGPGRSRMTFHTQRSRDAIVVIPRDAVRPLAEGRLDERLFHVRTLLAGNEARRSDAVRVIVTPPAGRRLDRAALAARPGRAVRPLAAIGGLGVTAAGGRAAGELWRDLTAGTARGSVGRVWLDGLRRVSLDHSVPQTGAPAAWRAGFDGAGVRVAVLDTGVDATHPDLAGRVVAARSFGTDTGDPAVDTEGHGTHVAATVAGSGAAGGSRRGMAPGARIVNGRVCDGSYCEDSAILEGMHWAVAEQGARVVNLSLGADDLPGTDPLEQAVNELTARHGALFVVAAGNSGGLGMVGSPSTADSALSVAAVDRAGDVARFSAKGLREDGAVKPEIAAPGVEINAARSGHSPGSGPYVSMSGTSMATPHVSGAAALLAQQHPDWTGAQLKTALVSHARPTDGVPVHAQGAGQVDVARAIGAGVQPLAPSVNFPRQEWPHDDDRPVGAPLAYRNPGPAPVTLALRLDMATADGRAASPGMFTLSTDRLTIAPGATAEVAVRADTRIDGALGDFAGAVTATAGDSTLRTPVGLQRDSERYDIRVTAVDRTGRPGNGVAFVTDAQGGTRLVVARAADQGPTTRLAKGTYTVLGASVSAAGDDDSGAWLAIPAFTVARAGVLALDARPARPIDVRVPHADSEPATLYLDTLLTDRPNPVSISTLYVSADDTPMYTAQLGPDRDARALRSMLHVERASGEAHDRRARPYRYHLAWQFDRRFPTGFDRDVAGAELAVLTTDVADLGAGSGYRGVAAEWSADQGGLMFIGSRAPRPVMLTEYFYSGTPRLRWHGATWEGDDPGDFLAEYQGAPLRYRAGRSYFEQWNRGVLAPALGPDQPAVGQLGNVMGVNAGALHFDGARRVGTTRGTGTITLRRDGRLIGESTDSMVEFPVPPGAGRYQLDVTARRPDLTIGTETRLRWTYALAPGGDDEPVFAPVTAVRYAPALDSANSTAAGRTITVPVRVEKQLAATRLGAVTVQLSYDDGRTWTDVELTGRNGRYSYTTTNPAAAGFASLRATVADRAGNTTEQTILRAYRIR
ncbi:S8 family serine peptidase [Pilimelia anulata]|nr:S8 family serine peptidase [Pilimelia anulata]